MTTTTRTGPPTLLTLLSLIALLLALLGGATAAVAEDEQPADEPTECEVEDGQASTATDTYDDCDDGDTDDEPGDEKERKFKDVPGGLPHVDGIEWLRDTGVTKGCAQGRYCPNKPVSRAEFATLAARLLGAVDGVDPVAAPVDELEALELRVSELEARVEALEGGSPSS